jgi:dTDP-4-amino-4,6-dideoxygalactose transaminase
LDLGRENGEVASALQAAMADVVRSGRFIGGEPCERFECAFAEMMGVDHAIGCASGSDALLLSLMALGIGPGDEVIVPSFTFFATASAVSRVGATPVFADIDAQTYNLDPASVAQKIHPSTKAIIPVHLFGLPADMAAIVALAGRHGLAVVEDCAQATGAQVTGRPVGSLGDVGCFSFYPTKNLAGLGDGGMITTHRASLASALRRLRAHGMEPRYYHQEIGINSRLDTLQAACLLQKLPHVPGWNARRCVNAQRYHMLFQEAGLLERVELPARDRVHDSVWNQFTIRVTGGRRDALRQFLSGVGIGTEVYYPLPLHLQACFAGLGYSRGSLPATERACDEVLSLPIFPSLTELEQRAVVARIAEYFAT